MLDASAVEISNISFSPSNKFLIRSNRDELLTLTVKNMEEYDVVVRVTSNTKTLDIRPIYALIQFRSSQIFVIQTMGLKNLRSVPYHIVSVEISKCFELNVDVRDVWISKTLRERFLHGSIHVKELYVVYEDLNEMDWYYEEGEDGEVGPPISYGVRVGKVEGGRGRGGLSK